jgi:3-oxoacyl-[acyl-carrier protein] reductase
MKKSLVLVTGATGGLGSAICKELSPNYDLVMVGRSRVRLNTLKKELEKHTNFKIFVIEIDFGKDKITTILNSQEHIDWRNLKALVNNAGISIGTDIFDLTEKDWDYDMKVNLKAPFLLSQFAVNKMKNSSMGGSIVNISSLAGVIGSNKPNYSASKAGLLGLTKSIALKAGTYGIRSNAIFPGAINTNMIDDWDEKKRDVIASKTSLKRIANPKEIALIVKFLVSDDSNYISGATINASGGQYTGY